MVINFFSSEKHFSPHFIGILNTESEYNDEYMQLDEKKRTCCVPKDHCFALFDFSSKS